MYPDRPEIRIFLRQGAKKEYIDGFKGYVHFYKISYCLILKLSLRISKNWISLSPIFVFKFSARSHFGFHDVIRLPNYSLQNGQKRKTVGRHKIQNGGALEMGDTLTNAFSALKI